MNFSFLGLHDLAIPLAQAIQAHPEHRITSIHADAPALTGLPHPEPEVDWEALLHNTSSDAIVVSPTDRPAVAEDRLRRLLQCELPVIAVQPYLGLLAAFEMSMIQSQTGSPLICYNPVDQHPIVPHLRAWHQDPASSPIGPITQLTIHAGVATTDRDHVLRCLAYDTSIIRNLIGTITQVSAMSTSPADSPFSNLNVNFTTASRTLATWTLDPTGQPDTRTIRIASQDQHREFTLNNGYADWHPDLSSAVAPGPPGPSPAHLFLEALPDRITLGPAIHEWHHWCQDIEASETVTTSLRRRRSIEILDEKRTEEGSFKGVMSMAGCALMLATLLLLLLGSVIEGFRLPARRRAHELSQPTTAAVEPPAPQQRALWVRLWPAYPFLLFLGLQTLRFVIKPPAAPHRPPSSD